MGEETKSPPSGTCSWCMDASDWHVPPHIDTDTGTVTWPCRGCLGTGCRSKCLNFQPFAPGISTPW